MYKLIIGKVIDMSTGNEIPAWSIDIDEEQFRLINMFADQEKDENLNITYIINKCRFKILPIILMDKPTTQA